MQVSHAGLGATMQKFNVNANLNCVIKHLSDKAISAVQINDTRWEKFRTTVGKGALFHPSSSTFV